MINFKNFPEAIELADLLYQKLVEDGLIDLYDYSLLPILEAKPEYGLRKISSGAIQILMEKEDVERLRDDKGNYTFTFKFKGVQKMENQTHLNAVGEITELLYFALNSEEHE